MVVSIEMGHAGFRTPIGPKVAAAARISRCVSYFTVNTTTLYDEYKRGRRYAHMYRYKNALMHENWVHSAIKQSPLAVGKNCLRRYMNRVFVR